MNKDILKAEGISKLYREGHRSLEVLKDISFSVKEGEFLAVQGPSGAGKSTLLHILGGLDNPSRGKVYFSSDDIYGMDEKARSLFRNRKVGFVFQFFHLLPELTAIENVMLPAMFKGFWHGRKNLGQARSLLERLGLAARLHHKPQELSGGEQQRVAICRALINRPRLLLCDEPTGNLDSENGSLIISLLAELNREEKITVVMVTHDKDIAKSASRLIHLKDGIILR